MSCFYLWRKEWDFAASGPSVGDMFVDLEGDPFVGENGCSISLGLRCSMCRRIELRKRWALNREEEKKGFEWLVTKLCGVREANPKMHVYHFGATSLER